MRRMSLCWSLLLMSSVAACGPAMGGTSLDLTVHLGDAPPPPVVVVREEPRLVMVPSSTVYVVDDRRVDYDCFRYGVYWYVFNDDYWYRARSYRGPFTVIETRYVPRAIITVPPKHWKHHPHGGPPGQMKKNQVVVAEKHGKGKDRD